MPSIVDAEIKFYIMFEPIYQLKSSNGDNESIFTCREKIYMNHNFIAAASKSSFAEENCMETIRTQKLRRTKLVL